MCHSTWGVIAYTLDTRIASSFDDDLYLPRKYHCACVVHIDLAAGVRVCDAEKVSYRRYSMVSPPKGTVYTEKHKRKIRSQLVALGLIFGESSGGCVGARLGLQQRCTMAWDGVASDRRWPKASIVVQSAQMIFIPVVEN